MNNREAIIPVLTKYHQQAELSQPELYILQEWLAESEEHAALFEGLENDIFAAKNNAPDRPNDYQASEKIVRDKVNRLDILQDDGSANAFEGTETFKEYEKDMSDDELDRLLSE